MKNKSLKWLNTVLFAATVIVNALANILPIGIGDTGAVSGEYPNLFAPAGITFAIWGVIYAALLLFILYQWGIFDKGEHSDKVVDSIGYSFAVSCLFNIAWIFAWHNDVIWLSLIFMVLLLISLIVIGNRIDHTDDKGFSYLAVNAPFDLYLGWVIAATIANVSTFLVSVGWDGFGISEVFWTCAVLIVGSVIGALCVLLKRKYFAGLGVIWAYIGVLIRHIGKSGFDGKYPAVIACAFIGIAIIVLGGLLNVVFDVKR